MSRIFLHIVAVIALVSSVGLSAGEEVNESPKESRVIAVVLGEEVREADLEEREEYLQSVVWSRLTAQYVHENELEATEEEIGKFIERLRQTMERGLARDNEELEELKADLESDELSAQQRGDKEEEIESLEEVISIMERMLNPPEEQKQADRDSSRRLAREWVTRWKVNKSLFEKFGGRVVFQQAGIEPYDACRQFLKDQEKAGAFQILDDELREEYWSKWPEDPPGPEAFVSEGEEAKEQINKRWWVEGVEEKEEAEEDSEKP